MYVYSTTQLGDIIPLSIFSVGFSQLQWQAAVYQVLIEKNPLIDILTTIV